VLTSRDRQDVCLALPDPPAGFGSTCATLDTVTRHGLVAMLTAPAPSTTPSRIAVVIPDGVPAPEIQYRDGRRVRLPVVNGVATASISGDGTLTVTAQEGSRQVPVQRQEPEW
jgi:FtsP/CotA-like multicopper oxidase with cupredoxin domain